MDKDTIENTKNNLKKQSTSKTSKSIKKNQINESCKKSTNRTTKIINSGSKTTKPSKYNYHEKPMDISEIFDIANSETKNNYKENIEKAIKNGDEKLKKNTDKKKINVTGDMTETKIKKSSTKIDFSNNNEENINKKNAAITSYIEARKFLDDRNIMISTITLDCKLHTLIDVDKFAKNVILKEDEIVSVKFGNRKDPATNRTIVVLKTKKKSSVKNFYNQVTILMKPMNNPIRNYINIKVFKNGSLQMTGCKDMNDFNNVTTTLIKILSRGRDMKNEKGKSIHVDFIDNPKNIGIYDAKIRMINSNFKLDYKIDRKKLTRLLKKNHRQGTSDKEIGYVECKYEPTSGHSCVNIKFKYDDKHKPSIFVFQTGAIIITGAKNLPQIIMAYYFIHKILNKYYDEIRIIELDYNAVQTEIAKFFKSNKKNIL